MVLNSFFILFWPENYTPQNMSKSPYDSDFSKVVRFGWNFAFWVIRWCWIQFLFSFYLFFYFLVPRSAVGTYGLAFVRACVGSFVCSAEISKSVHRNFLFLAQSWGFLMRRKWHFWILPQKVPFGHFWPILVKKLPFSAKNQRPMNLHRPISQNLLIGSS